MSSNVRGVGESAEMTELELIFGFEFVCLMKRRERGWRGSICTWA